MESECGRGEDHVGGLLGAGGECVGGLDGEGMGVGWWGGLRCLMGSRRRGLGGLRVQKIGSG